MPVPESNAEDPDEEPEDKELEDEEVKELQSVQKTLMKSYINWLQLMVAHFDAVEIVLQYVMLINFNHKSISVTNLVAPSTSMDLYSWEELIKNEKYFPTKDTINPMSTTSNDQILEFLQEVIPKVKKLRSFRFLPMQHCLGGTNIN